MLRFAATIFLSAFLLFLVQPLIAKFLLPWFGGGAGAFCYSDADCGAGLSCDTALAPQPMVWGECRSPSTQ